MKNSGMMKPPGQPDETVSDVPISFASNAAMSTLTTSRCCMTNPVCASPKVSAYGDQSATMRASSPPTTGRTRTGTTRKTRPSPITR